MKILVHDYSGHPFQVQLSRTLAARGHQVLHLHCPSYHSGKGNLDTSPVDAGSLGIEGVALGEDFNKYQPVQRLRQEIRYARRFIERAQRFDADIILSANAPLVAHARISAWAFRRRIPFVFWQQDVYSVAMAREGIRRLPLAGRQVGRLFTRLERRIALRSTEIICITDDFIPILTGWGVPRDKISVIENWAPIAELPVRPRDNAWAREHGLEGGLNLIYSGTLGLKHDPSLIISLAKASREMAGARVVVVSQGPGADWIRATATSLGLTNVVVLDFQPFQSLPDVLAAGDVLLLLLQPDAGVFSVPSKLLTYLCVGRPVVAAIPSENLAARILARAAAGVAVAPGDGDGFARAAMALLAEPEQRDLMGRSARRYAEREFDVDLVTDRFEEVLDRAVAGRLFRSSHTTPSHTPAVDVFEP